MMDLTGSPKYSRAELEERRRREEAAVCRNARARSTS
jgi:hypothetical protein